MISLREYILNNIYPYMPLYEQALNRDKLINKIMDNISMLLSHWGLIEYAFGDYDAQPKYVENISKWKRELKTFCGNIGRFKIKGGKRENAISYALINQLEINDQEQVYIYIKDKFDEEDIDMLTTRKIAKYLSDNYKELVDALVNQTYIEWANEL